MAFSEYQCPNSKCNSNNISVVSIHRVSQQLAHDDHDNCETVGDIIESEKIDTIHYRCRECNYISPYIVDFKLIHYND